MSNINKKQDSVMTSKPLQILTSLNSSQSKLEIKSGREAYLLPLLERHNHGKTVSYEDLQMSYQAGKIAIENVPKLQIGNDKTNRKIQFQLDELDKLHESQIQAYENAAQIFLTELGNKFTAPPLTKATTNTSPSKSTTPAVIDMTENEYINKCTHDAMVSCEGWKVEKSIIEEYLLTEIRKKAKEYYHEQKSVNAKNTSTVNNTIKEVSPLNTGGNQNDITSGEGPTTGSDDVEQSGEETHEDTTSEEDAEEEGVGRDEDNNHTENIKDNHSKPKSQTPKVNTAGVSISSTTISLTKVTNNRKRPFNNNSQGLSISKKPKKKPIGNALKNNRGARGRGRPRRGGKN